MKVKDPAHAVRILKALVEQGQTFIESVFDPSIIGQRPMGAVCLVLALVEGAKAVLASKMPSDIEFQSERFYGSIIGNDSMLMTLAQAYAPRMIEVGMEVPE